MSIYKRDTELTLLCDVNVRSVFLLHFEKSRFITNMNVTNEYLK